MEILLCALFFDVQLNISHTLKVNQSYQQKMGIGTAKTRLWNNKFKKHIRAWTIEQPPKPLFSMCVSKIIKLKSEDYFECLVGLCTISFP